MEFKKQFVNWRKKKGWNCIKTADYLGTTPAFITMVEHGYYPSPKILKKVDRNVYSKMADKIIDEKTEQYRQKLIERYFGE